MLTRFFLALQETVPADQLGRAQEGAGPAAGSDSLVQGFTGSVSSLPLPALLAGAVICMVLGGLVVLFTQRVMARSLKKQNKPKWPRDWPGNRDIFTKDPTDATKPGYLPLQPDRAMGSGAMPIGRTYPRLRLFPDMFPLRDLRRWVEYLTSRPVWIPYSKRFQHFGVLGATGKGKSTSFVYPTLAYGAFEENSAYFAIDVKSPEFARVFGDLYKKAGKPVLFFDPWSPDETLAFEPLWRANDEKKDIIAEVINTYSAEGGQMTSSENSEFFKLAANRVLRGIVELAQFWPRRHCNLPCVQQLIAAGGNAIVEAFENARDLFPDLDELLAAVERVIEASDEELRDTDRSDVLNGALAVLDRSGYRIGFAVRRMRALQRRRAAGELDDAKWGRVEEVFWSQIKQEWLDRREQLESLLMKQGEFINQPEDTRNSVISTLANKVSWFRDSNIAKAFSRDELRVDTLVDRPCLMLIGAPMAKLKVGSLFVASIISNLGINAVFQRGMRMHRDKQGVSGHGIFFMLDEFPQLQIKDAPSILATFRGFKSGLMMIYQERGQLQKLYGDDVSTMEGNMVHQVLLQGAHPETCKFYAEAMPEAQIEVKSKSGASGEKMSISTSIESKPLMGPAEIREMRLNDKRMPNLALSVGSDTTPFPMRPIPYYEDPTLRNILGLKRDLIKDGPGNEETWKFWHWKEFWNPTSESPPILQRRKRKSPRERDAGADDPVHARLQDPYTQYLDFLLDNRREFDELTVPQLRLPDIGVTENDPRGAAVAEAQKSTNLRKKGRPGQKGGPAIPASMLVPVYGQDVRTLINQDFGDPEAVPPDEPVGGPLDERIDDDPADS